MFKCQNKWLKEKPTPHQKNKQTNKNKNNNNNQKRNDDLKPGTNDHCSIRGVSLIKLINK